MKKRVYICTICFFSLLILLGAAFLKASPLNLCQKVLAATGTLNINAVTGTQIFPGNSAWNSTGLGIGTTSPAAKLDVSGATSTILAPNQTLTVGSTHASGGIVFKTGNSDRAIINNSGYLGLGTLSPTYQLQLSNDSAYKPNGGAFSGTSDVRCKENITPFNDGLSVVRKLNPVNYTYNGKGGTPKGSKGIGLIAQAVKDVIPYTIQTFKAKLNPKDKEDTELLSFNQSALTFVLVNSVKELDNQIKSLTQSFKKLNTGSATIIAGKQNVIIYNSNIMESSKIFLTAISPTKGLSLYVSKKEVCPDKSSCKAYFQVSVESPAISDINFDWMIVN